MTPEERINELIKEAMKSKQRERLEALRAIKSAILLEKTKEGATGEISEEQFIKMLQKLVKQRRDSAQIYRQQNRSDLAEKEEFEANIIKEFLPAPMSNEELQEIIGQIIREVGAQSVKDMGKVMGKATSILAGKADNKAIADTVKKLLS